MTTSFRRSPGRYFNALAICLALGLPSCTPAPTPAQRPVVDVSTTAGAAHQEAPLVSFEGAAKTLAPSAISDFVTRFFESMHKDWRSGIQFMDPENYQELKAQNPKLDPVSNDASILVFAISLIRFNGSGDPPDTDTDIERIKAISSVHVKSFEQNAQVYQLGGEIKLKDGRTYGLQLVLARDKLAVVGPL